MNTNIQDIMCYIGEIKDIDECELEFPSMIQKRKYTNGP